MELFDVEQIVAKAGELPAMPAIAQKVMELAGNENTSPQDMQRVIQADPALAMKILKVANSALFSRSHAISTLSHAILVLGFSTIRSLVVASSVKAVFRSKGGDYGLKERLLWEHSLGCAIAARVLAQRLGYNNLESAFMGGLLHDIGKVVLNTNLPDEYMEIFREVYNEQRSSIEVEIERIGFDHTDVGSLVVRKWNFSEDLEDLIANHHSPGQASRDPKGAAVVHLANLFCERLGIGARPVEELDLGAAESAPMLGIGERDMPGLLSAVREIFEKEKGLFDS